MSRSIKPKDMYSGTTYSTNKQGDIIVLNYINSLKVLVMFKNTGTCVLATASRVRKGIVKDPNHRSMYGVGYIGEGNYNSRTMVNNVMIYTVWTNMIRRCYSKVYCGYKYYGGKGVTVAKEWHNYQSFASWCIKQSPKDSDQLDKDIYGDSTEYSPEKCRFVSKIANLQESSSKTYSVIDPNGILISITNLSKYARDNNLSYYPLRNVCVGRTRSYQDYKAV